MRYVLVLLFIGLSFHQGHAQSALSFDHEALLVKDLSRSVEFYTETLGLQEIENGTGLPHIRWFSLGGSESLHLIEDKNFSKENLIGIHFALRTENLDQLMATLKEQKVPFKNWQGAANTTNTRADGVRQIYLQDPDGYWIEINENE